VIANARKERCFIMEKPEILVIETVETTNEGNDCQYCAGKSIC